LRLLIGGDEVDGLWWTLAKCSGGVREVVKGWHVRWMDRGRWVLGLAFIH
jgi:hypothetical protein